MKRLFLFCLSLLAFILGSQDINAQVYQDKFGAGNDVGVNVSSSGDQDQDKNIHTLSGTGLIPDMIGASRFLSQASLAANYEEIEYVTQIGIKAWIDEQIAMPYTSFTEKFESIEAEVNDLIQTVHPGEVMDNPGEMTGFAFWESAIRDPEVLRNKTAFSLLQILVVSRASIQLDDAVDGHTSYYDILYDGAFGNYRDILEEVSLHLMMGFYLSHFQNEKADPTIGTLPDENYAREIMQLFTIGLWELNIDGTQKLDENGQAIPTYDIDDIQELAKVFTGLSGGAYNLELFPELENESLRFNRGPRNFDVTVPMAMYEDFHDQGEKVLVDGTVIPAGQPGMEDVQMALDVLFNHPNVGPFLAIRMIQQMVKSNPTPDYVKRVALAFNNNGQGVRGDMEAVVKAVLLDPEAIECHWIDDERTGKLKQPIERVLNIFRGFNIDSPSGRLWFFDRAITGATMDQAFMAAPTVFNFFTPFYAENDIVEPNDMVSPEFQILHAVTAMNYLNLTENALMGTPFPNRTRVNPNNPRLAFNNNNDNPYLDLSEEIAILENDGVSALLDRLDLIMCHGSLGEETKNIIQSALEQYQSEGSFDSERLVKTGLYFIFVSPDYVIQQ